MAPPVTVQVPATSANLGPGFDCLGLALNLFLRVSCQPSGGDLRISANDSGISTGPDNLVYRAIQAVAHASGRPLAGLDIAIENGIPLSRGLGSSAAAITAGLMLGNELGRGRLDKRQLLDIGLPLEGHPDNLAPALFGGLCVSTVADGAVLSVPVKLTRAPSIVLFIPEFAMSTAEARSVLPDSVPRGDAVFNTGRAALLVAALAAGDFRLVRWAMDDRLHQPYRAALFPALPKLISAALEAGAAGAALSGAGSTVIALCETNADAIARALQSAAGGMGLAGSSATAQLDQEGARIIS
jgi:homoserine kinase